MKLLLYGMDTCGGCANAKAFLEENRIPFMYLNIAENTGNLKKFLKLRDHEAMFDEVKESGRIGVPCFRLDDGTLTFDLNEVLEKMGETVRFEQRQC